VLPGQEVVDLVREDELLDLDVSLAEGFRERNGLAERDVAVVVAVDEEDG
jgi:hypothetical protein